MIDVTFSFKKEKITKPIPTRWSEVDFETFLKLLDCGSDYAKVMDAITGIPKDVIVRAKIANLETLINLLSFLNTAPPTTIPETIMGYKIPSDLAFQSIGQYEDLKNDYAARTSKEDILRQYPLYCAIYACDEYDWEKAELLAPIFLKAPAGEVLAVGNFTLMKLTALMKGIKVDSLIRNIRRRSLKLALRILLKRLGSMLRFYTWRKKPATRDTSY